MIKNWKSFSMFRISGLHSKTRARGGGVPPSPSASSPYFAPRLSEVPSTGLSEYQGNATTTIYITILLHLIILKIKYFKKEIELSNIFLNRKYLYILLCSKSNKIKI